MKKGNSSVLAVWIVRYAVGIRGTKRRATSSSFLERYAWVLTGYWVRKGGGGGKGWNRHEARDGERHS